MSSSSKIAKKIRKAVKKEDYAFLAKFRESIKLMKFTDRAQLAWQILTKSFGKDVKNV